jgi:hypothetical protein
MIELPIDLEYWPDAPAAVLCGGCSPRRMRQTGGWILQSEDEEHKYRRRERRAEASGARQKRLDKVSLAWASVLAASAESGRASPPHGPQEDRLAPTLQTLQEPVSNALGLCLRWRLS